MIIKQSILKEVIKEIVKAILKEGIGNPKDWGVVVPPKRLYDPISGIYPSEFESVKNYIRIKESGVGGEFVVAWFSNGKFNDDKSYYTDDLRDAVNTFNAMKKQVDAANGTVKEDSVAASASPITGPNAFAKKKTMQEMTTTGAVQGYNVPGAFSSRGGSKAGIEGSEKLGYTLTNAGKKDMNRSADKLMEFKKK